MSIFDFLGGVGQGGIGGQFRFPSADPLSFPFPGGNGGQVTTPPFNPDSPDPSSTDPTKVAAAAAASGLPASMVNLITQLIKMGLPIAGAVDAAINQNFLNSGKTDVQALLNKLGSGYQDQINGIQGSFLPQFTGMANNLSANSQAQQNSLGQNINTGLNGINKFNNAVNPYTTVPGSEGVINYLSALQGVGNQSLGGLQGSLGQLQPGLGAASSLGEGNNPLLGAMNQAGMGLYQNQGMNATTSAAQNAGIQALQNFGQTPQLQQIQQMATGMYGNPAGQYGVQRGQQILGQNPLLPMDQVLSMAENQSATGAKNQYNNLKRQLLNTTGVTGPMIAGGGQNELLSQLGDQSLQNQSSAMTQALMGQQGLQSGLFGQAAGLYGSSSGLGQQGQSTALQALLGGSGQALQNQTGLGGLALNGGNLDLSRLLGGTSTLNSSLNNQLGGLGALGSLFGQQTGAYNSLNNLLGTLGQNSQDQGNLFMGAQQLGLGQNTAQFNALNNLLGQQGNLSGQQQSGALGAATFPANALQQYLQQLGSGSTSQVGLFGTVAPQNYFNVASSPFAMH